LSPNILKPFLQFCQCCWSWCSQRSEKNIFAMHYLTWSWIFCMIKLNTPGSWSIHGFHNIKQVQFWASQDHCFLCCDQCLKGPMSEIKTVKVLPPLWRNRGTL
jgi:hypothetical protein